MICTKARDKVTSKISWSISSTEGKECFGLHGYLFGCYCKITEEVPQSFFPPSFLFLVVCRVWGEVNSTTDRQNVRKDINHIGLRVCVLRVLNCLSCLGHINSQDGIKERLVW